MLTQMQILKKIILVFIYFFFLIYIGGNLFLVVVLGFVGSMAVDFDGIVGLIPYLYLFIIFLLVNLMLYFLFRKLYNWAKKD